MNDYTAIYISYSQFGVFNPNLPNPFNDWRPQHVTQGFAWRPGSVFFKTLEDDITLSVIMKSSTAVAVGKDCIRAILVPFYVPDSGYVEVASITDGIQFPLSGGNYALLCEQGYAETGSAWCRLTFTAQLLTEASIPVADEGITPSYPLIMEAEAA